MTGLTVPRVAVWILGAGSSAVHVDSRASCLKACDSASCARGRVQPPSDFVRWKANCSGRVVVWAGAQAAKVCTALAAGEGRRVGPGRGCVHMHMIVPRCTMDRA
ncbi:hypothetical protein C8Q73DRAFT_495660 [Cubamyces lactineus]|nr:hypothetical protein C8Q73DRAFT_495660 [Cubamyces lactineus]